MRDVKSIDLRDLVEFNLIRRGGGKGTIILGPSDNIDWGSMGSENLGRCGTWFVNPVFEMIDNAETVYQQILGQKKEIENRKTKQIMTPIEDDGLSQRANSND